jgi:hypothetical protein
MFGYLNLGNARMIAANEAQEASNVRVDRGFLEFAEWATSTPTAREVNVGSVITGGKVHRSLPYPDETGAIVWDYLAVTNDKLGIAVPVAVPIVAAIAHGSQPYPAGTYQWAMTLYNPVTGEESVPVLTADIVIGVNEVAQFSDIPSYATTYPKKTYIVWNIYRRPLGSGEYLLALTLPAFGAATDDVDDTVDTDLGEACDSFENNVLAVAKGMEYANEKLWIYDGKVLSFSKTSKPWAFPATFKFTWGDTITGVYAYNEYLVVTLESDKARIIYGDDEDNFAVKTVDAAIGIAPNCARVVAGMLLMAQQTNQVAVVAPEEKEPLIDGVTIFDGARPVNISNAIKSLFPRFGHFENLIDDAAEPKTGVVENRFYVLNVSDIVFPLATQADIPATPGHFSIIYDVLGKGFLTAVDGATTFSYRTKQFANPPRAKSLHRFSVDTEGPVTVEVYLNEELATTVSLNNATRKDDWFSVKPWRCDSFSIRFIGQAAAKVYGFALVDPPMAAG